MTSRYLDIAEGEALPPKLAERVMAGEVFVIRKCLQRLGIFDEVETMSLDAISAVAGSDVAGKLQDEGIDAIHEHASLSQIAAITDKIYEAARIKGPGWIAKVAPDILGIRKSYYFEKLPNIRFHVPYDVLAADRETLKKFAGARGGGKLSAHPNHRDSWVGCPDNLINVWIAVAPIPQGNGLTLFPESFTRDLANVGASIAYEENPGVPLNFDLDPGDAILFHGDHLHSSVLNRTDRTRHALSFRIVNEKPNFPNGHYHHYLHSSLAGGPLNMLAEVPANLAWSYVGTRVGWVKEKLGMNGKAAAKPNVGPRPNDAPLGGERTFPLSALPEGELRAITSEVCVARIGKKQLVAFDRKCPHGGGDLALGTVTDGEITCPWHNLRIDPKTGASACQTLRKIRLYDVRLDGDRVTVSLDQQAAAS